jgi:hypothetical protein
VTRRHGTTLPGLPRPRDAAGQPIPWNSDAENLGLRLMKRTRRTAGGWICQVCGLRFQPDERAVLFGTHDPTGEVSTPDPGQPIPGEAGIHAMDHGLLHRPCARIALAHCPALKAMRAAGDLVCFDVPPGSIEAWGADAIAVALDHL